MSADRASRNTERTSAHAHEGLARIGRRHAVDDRHTAGDRSGVTGIRGFTLIELLVVISVVVLLLAILLPSLQAVRRKTKALVCRSNLRQWGMIWRMYTSDNDGAFHNGKIGDWRDLWMEALWPYYSLSRDICLCPMAATPSEVLWKGQNAMGTTFTAWTIFTGNYSWDRDGFSGSYGINGWTRNPPEDVLAQYQGNFPTANNYRKPDVEGAWQVPLFLDCRWPDGWMSHQYPPPQMEDEPTWARYCINRHDGTVNALFMDWSTRKVGLKELWTLKWHRECETMGPWTQAGGAEPQDWPLWMRRLKDY